MPYWRTRIFRMHLLLGWLVAWAFLGLLQAFASVEDTSMAGEWIAAVSLHVLALLAAFMHARYRAWNQCGL